MGGGVGGARRDANFNVTARGGEGEELETQLEELKHGFYMPPSPQLPSSRTSFSIKEETLQRMCET